MYEECGYFDQHDGNPVGAAGGSCSGINIGTNRSRFDGNLRLQAAAAASSLEELTGQHMNASFAGIDQHLQHQLALDLGQDFHGYLIQEAAATECNWNPAVVPPDAAQEDAHHTDLRMPPYAPDLLNFLHLPRQPPPTPNFSGSPSRKAANFPVDIFGGEILGADGGTVALYDAASVQLGYSAPAPHLLRDLFHPLPQNYGLFYGVNEREAAAAADIGGGGLVFQDGEAAGHYEDVMFEVRRDGRAEGNGAGYTNIEKQRREQLGEKFKLLKSLVPNPTKNDRASTLSDAIAYINELKRTIEELTILVGAKRYARSRKRGKTEEEEPAPAPETEIVTPSMGPPRDDDTAAYRRPDEGALRSSWIQRRSRETFVDVRIVDDDVNIKMTRRKRPSSCLLSASKAIEEELQLELLHVSEGHIGDSHIFVFNTKISEGSYVYASAVAKKLLEAVDRPCSAVPARN